MMLTALGCFGLGVIAYVCFATIIYSSKSRYSTDIKDFLEGKRQAKQDHADKIVNKTSELMSYFLSDNYSHEKMLRDAGFVKLIASVKFAYENQYTKV